MTAVALSPHAAPVVAAVEPHAASATADVAARLARELGTTLAFVSVRPRLPADPGGAYGERQLTRDLVRSRKVLDTAIAAAHRQGVMSYGEIVEGDPATKIVEFAAARNAPVLVVGRDGGIDPSISRKVIALSRRPVVLAPHRLGAGQRVAVSSIDDS